MVQPDPILLITPLHCCELQHVPTIRDLFVAEAVPYSMQVLHRLCYRALGRCRPLKMSAETRAATSEITMRLHATSEHARSRSARTSPPWHQ
ncbi:hypothetical protein HBH77_029600 [Parastagonospora nodorum]|nr:hypothetical protein HBH49_016410 [Parastagonospora nodorum]KAH4973645.1 hypothetical protein HBI78_004530 [Parastagonospora nodorum]KAH5223121.1 hypothetical protein HBH77_029600 [Parastagonospora nodorum]KAH5313401.1 hypothetical protein HBI50_146840 [Parastagonospora nodorum]KAH5322543.1 hypothetical protein HBI12_092970 [Parastagonospora nodorum]